MNQTRAAARHIGGTLSPRGQIFQATSNPLVTTVRPSSTDRPRKTLGISVARFGLTSAIRFVQRGVWYCQCEHHPLGRPEACRASCIKKGFNEREQYGYRTIQPTVGWNLELTQYSRVSVPVIAHRRAQSLLSSTIHSPVAQAIHPISSLRRSGRFDQLSSEPTLGESASVQSLW